jgi:hypothetical protein
MANSCTRVAAKGPARLLGFKPQAVQHLWEAGRLLVGECDETTCGFRDAATARLLVTRIEPNERMRGSRQPC